MNGFGQRLASFAEIIYEPKQHFFFASLWFFSISGLYVLLSESASHWSLGMPALLAAITFFVVLFVLRAIDEVKDFEYDKTHNTDRPLVCGAVSKKDISAYVLLGVLVLVLVNLPVSPLLAWFVVFNIGYGLLLMKLEQWIPLMGKSLFFNLLLTYPVSIALSFYALLNTSIVQGAEFDVSQLLVVGCYILAFLHFELVRKCMWQELSQPSEMLYSNEVGTVPALIIATFCGVAACVGIVLLLQPWELSGFTAITGWLPLVNILFVFLSIKLFFTNRHQRFNPRKFSVPFIVGFYALNLIHALTWNPLQLQVW